MHRKPSFTLILALIVLGGVIVTQAPAPAQGLRNLALAENGAIFFAEPTAVGNGSLTWINDGKTNTYWYAGDNQPKSTVLVLLKGASTVQQIRFLSWATGRHAPRDYQIQLINSATGEAHTVASVTGDTTVNPNWVEINFAPVVADRVVMRIFDVQEHQHGAVIYEFQVMGAQSGTTTGHGLGALDPAKTWVVFGPGKSLATAYGGNPITLKVIAGLPGQEQVVFNRQYNEPALSQVAVDLSQWEGRTINLKFQVEGTGGDVGVWVNPRIVKAGQTLLDLIYDWSQYYECTVVGNVTFGDTFGDYGILGTVTGATSSVTFSVPLSASLLRSRSEQRIARQQVDYGATEDRLRERADIDSQIDLSGDWQLASRDPDPAHPFGDGEQRAIPDMTGWVWTTVSVPGSIRSCLFGAGQIADPYWSTNAADSRWVEAKEWWFRKSVTVPAAWSGRRVFLGFDGVDYYSSVWLNGTFLGDHEGMYGGPVKDVTSLVHFGQPNDLVVLIHRGGTDEPERIFKGFIFMKWHYQTDMSPRGIWSKARLVSTGGVRLEHPFVKTLSISQSAAELEVSVDAYNSGAPGPVTVSGSIAGANFTGGDQAFTIQADLPTGWKTLTYRLLVASPRLWWPHGMGDPNLYSLRLSATAGGSQSDAISARFGIRTIEVLNNPGLDPGSRFLQYTNASRRNQPPLYPFIMKINGKVISMRGAGGYSAHDQLYRFYTEKDRWFTRVAQALNYNFLRLHGAGMIGTDDFYNDCDEMGMMVWQEFMIANWELKQIRPEVWRTQVVQSIYRLRNHPSLVYWCGGNEFDTDSAHNKPTVDMFERMLAQHDGTRPFTRSSPWGGDLHYANENTYDISNFAACSEYSGAFDGSIVQMRALSKFVPAADVTRWPPTTTEKLNLYLPSDVLQGWDNTQRGPFAFHTALTDRLPGWVGDMELVIPTWLYFGVPRSMEDAIEFSQIHNGLMTSYIMEAYRAHWPLPSLYVSWDYAPIWPMSITWGPIDYYGGVQPCAYYYKRGQEPLHVLMQYGANSYPRAYAPGQQFEGKVYVVSDLDSAISDYTVSVSVLNAQLQRVTQSQFTLSNLAAGPSTAQVGTFSWQIPAGMTAQPMLVALFLKNSAGEIASRSVYPIWVTPEASAMMADPSIRRDRGPWLTQLKSAQTQFLISRVSQSVDFTGDEATAVLDITNIGTKPAFNTGLEIEGADCRYICDDNYFYLLPLETKRVTVQINKGLHPFYEGVKPELIHPVGASLRFTVNAWNAPPVSTNIPCSGLVTAWEFDRDGYAEGWKPTHSLSSMTVSGGVLSTTVTGADPFGSAPAWVAIDADAQRYIVVRMAVSSGSVAEFFWGTQARPYHEAGREVQFNIISDGQFHTYVIDMSANPQWTGIVNSLRLDPTEASSGTVRIDYVRVGVAPS